MIAMILNVKGKFSMNLQFAIKTVVPIKIQQVLCAFKSGI